MKKLLIILVTIGLYAQKVELELVWEREFESPIKAFTYSMERGIPVPEIVITENEVKFLKFGKVIPIKKQKINEKETRFYDAFFSPNGKYIGIRKEHQGEYGRLLKGSEFLIYDNKGNLLAKKEISDDYRPFKLLNNGAVLFSGSFEEPRIFLEQLDGTRKVIFDCKKCDMMPSGYVELAKKANYFAMVMSNMGIYLFDVQGNKIWEYNIKKFHAAGIAISDGGKYVASLIMIPPWDWEIYLLSLNGRLLFAQKTHNFYINCWDFSPDERFLAVNTKRNKIALFDLFSQKKLWEYKFEDSSKKFFSINVSKEGKFIVAVSGDANKEEGIFTLYLIRKDGKVVWEKRIKTKNLKKVKAQFVDTNKHLIIKNYNKLYCYEIKEVGDER